MGWPAIISSALEAVRATTDSLFVDVQIEPWIGPPLTFGGPEQYDDPFLIRGFVQEGLTHNKRSDGQVILTKAKIGLLEEVPDNPAPDRQNPIDPRDRVTLASGLTGHLAELPGVMINPVTCQPFVRVLWLA